MPDLNRDLSRRRLLEGSGLALAGVAAGSCAPGSDGAGNQAPGTEGIPALGGGQDALPPKDLSDAWSATPDRNPRVLFAAEGCETKRFKRLGENRYEVWSKVMTVFKDPETREILNGKEFRNPYYRRNEPGGAQRYWLAYDSRARRPGTH